MNPSLLSSVKMDWTTPPSLIGGLRKQGFNIGLDVAASEENAVCDTYYDEAANGLERSWNVGNRWAWCNPPYGRELPKWVSKACFEALTHASRILLLVPARTDTRWFRQAAASAQACGFFAGRLSFGDGSVPAPFPSALFKFDYAGAQFSKCLFQFIDKEGMPL